MNDMIGVIGGSGFERFTEFQTLETLDLKTPFGDASSGFKRVRVGSHEFLFISRHGDHHELLPSEINYRANIYALKKAGVKAVVSFSAVGSLAKEYKPGDLVLPAQYMDRTKGIRRSTFLGGGLVGHVSLAKPVCDVMLSHATRVLTNVGFEVHAGSTYVCIEGPYFSTQAESLNYRQMGAQIIGMSNFPEYALAREAGLPYLPCCFVTDFDCWDDSIAHVTVDEVIRLMKLNNSKAFTVLERLLGAGNIWSGSSAPQGGLVSGLFMPRESIPAEMRPWVEVLLK